MLFLLLLSYALKQFLGQGGSSRAEGVRYPLPYYFGDYHPQPWRGGFLITTIATRERGRKQLVITTSSAQRRGPQPQVTFAATSGSEKRYVTRWVCDFELGLSC